MYIHRERERNCVCVRERESFGSRTGRGMNALNKMGMSLLNLRRTSLYKCAVIPMRARFQGAWTCGSLNSGLESDDRLWRGPTRREDALFWDRPRVVYHRVYLSIRRYREREAPFLAPTLAPPAQTRFCSKKGCLEKIFMRGFLKQKFLHDSLILVIVKPL